MSKTSAGLLMYRHKNNQLEVFLVHPGGPFNRNKDLGVWGIPKGLQENNNDLLETAKREFSEETGIEILDPARMTNLDFVTYKNGKKVYCWAFEQDLPENSPRFAGEAGFKIKSNLTPQGWPEIDRGEFFPVDVALQKIIPAQRNFLTCLQTIASKFLNLP